MAVNLKSAELKIYIYTGSAGTSNRGDAKYTLNKTRISSEPNIIFEISELVKDYLPVVFDGNPEDTRLNAWVETDLTRTFVDTVTGNESTDQEPLTRRYIAFRGYGEIYDVNSTTGTNTNPDTSYDILISNRTVYHLDGSPLYIPFFTAPESGVHSIEYYNEDNLVETQTFGGSVEYFTTSTTNVKTSAIEPYRTDTTALRANNDGSFSSVAQIATSVTKLVFTDKNGNEQTVDIKMISECKYHPYKISFINKFGAIQQVWFFKRSDKRLDIEKDEYIATTLQHTDGNIDFGVYDHVNKNIAIKGTKSITLNTGYVTEDHNEVIKQMLISDYCWIHENQSSTPAPVKPKNLSFKDSLGVNEKLINFTLDFEYSHNYIQDVR